MCIRLVYLLMNVVWECVQLLMSPQPPQSVLRTVVECPERERWYRGNPRLTNTYCTHIFTLSNSHTQYISLEKVVSWSYKNYILSFRWEFPFWCTLNSKNGFLETVHLSALAPKSLDLFWPNPYFGPTYGLEKLFLKSVKFIPVFWSSNRKVLIGFYTKITAPTILIKFVSKLGLAIPL